jgi:hypothetical protein
MNDINLKQLGWKLALLPSFREWYQKSVIEWNEKRIKELNDEISRLKNRIKEMEEWEEELKKLQENHENWIREIFTNELEEFDVTNFFPHLTYLKGLQYHQERYKRYFPKAKFLASLDRRLPFPEEHIENIISQIKSNLEEIYPNLTVDMIQRYYAHDEDMVIVRIDSYCIVASIYDDRKVYETVKAEKSEELDSEIDEISR